MEIAKQVDKSHYEFSSYMSKPRWNSLWHQLDEVMRLAPENVLEIGPGPGTFKHVAALFGLKVDTLDLDAELKPDHIASATALPFPDKSYDVTCAFQMLEHLPFESSLTAFAEMARVSRKNIIISLPDAKIAWHFRFHIPRVGPYHALVTRPSLRKQVHKFDGEHHWEINKVGYGVSAVVNAFENVSAYKLYSTYRVMENPYHRFFLFERTGRKQQPALG